jgi:hypothetical protein
MKKIILLFLLIAGFTINNLVAQGDSCVLSEPFCTGSIYTFPAGVNSGTAEPGAYYGCLTTQPNPAWYHMKIATAGDINIHMYSTPLYDIDFICWGPFSDPTSPCVSQLTANMVVDCSYSPAPPEDCYIPNGQVGEYYILLITNYSNQPCDITFEKTSGTGETDCTIVPPPVSNNGPLCVHGTLQLFADTINNATYFWSGPAGFTSTQQNPIIMNVGLENAGDYQLIITVNGNASDPVVTTVIINALPSPDFSANDVCYGDTTHFIDQSTVDPPTSSITSWHWDFGDGQTASGQNQDYLYGNSGEYDVSLTTYTGFMQCARTITKTVHVYDAAAVNAGEDQTIPNGWNTQLDATVEGGSGSYDILWTPEEKLIDPTQEDPMTVNLNQTIQFTINVTDANSGCQNSDSVMVMVTGGPLSVQAVASPSVICQGDIVNLDAVPQGGSGNNTYTWTSDPPGFTANIKNPSDFPQTSTTYTVEVFDGQNTVTASIFVQVKPKPVAFAGDDMTINVGTVATLLGTANSGSGTYTYQWSPADSVVNPNSAVTETKILNTSNEFTFVVNDANGCVSDPDKVWVFVGGSALGCMPTAEPDVICQGETTTLHVNPLGGSGSYTYQWSDDNGWTSNNETPQVSPMETTTYTISVDDGFKTIQNHVTVLVNHTPQVNLVPQGITLFSEDTIKVCVRDSVILDAGDSINPAVMDYYWSNSATSRKLTVTTNGNWVDFQTYSVITTNPVTQCSGSDTLTVWFDFNQCQIGIDENSDFEKYIKLIPNPANGILKIEITELKGNVSLTINDINGKKLYSALLTGTSKHRKELNVDLSSWNKGVYILHVVNNSKMINAKIIKK